MFKSLFLVPCLMKWSSSPGLLMVQFSSRTLMSWMLLNPSSVVCPVLLGPHRARGTGLAVETPATGTHRNQDANLWRRTSAFINTHYKTWSKNVRKDYFNFLHVERECEGDTCGFSSICMLKWIAISFLRMKWFNWTFRYACNSCSNFSLCERLNCHLFQLSILPRCPLPANYHLRHTKSGSQRYNHSQRFRWGGWEEVSPCQVTSLSVHLEFVVGFLCSLWVCLFIFKKVDY